MTMRRGEHDYFVARTALCLLPILVWALHFGLVYGGAHVACEVAGTRVAERMADGLVIGATAIALLIILAAGLGAGYWLRQISGSDPDENVRPFLRGVIRGLALLSFFGVLWAGLAAVFLQVCANR